MFLINTESPWRRYKFEIGSDSSLQNDDCRINLFLNKNLSYTAGSGADPNPGNKFKNQPKKKEVVPVSSAMLQMNTKAEAKMTTL